MSPKQIKALRKKLTLTQQQLADIIGAQRVTVARWEGGFNEPQGANLKALKELQSSLKIKVMSVPVDQKIRDEFKKRGRELGRCLVCKEPWGKRTSTDLLSRHEKCFRQWEDKYSTKPAR